MDEPAGDARYERVVGHEQLERVVGLLAPALEHRVELLGLRRRAREAVEDEAERGLAEFNGTASADAR